MKAEMRAWRGGGEVERRGGEERRGLRGTPDQLSFKLRPGVRDRAYLLCWLEWAGKHWPPRIAPPVTDMFSLRGALKFERRTEGASEGGAAKDKRWKDVGGYTQSIVLFLYSFI